MLFRSIDDAIAEEPPLTIKDGGIIKKGYNADLDKLLKGSSEGKDWLISFEADERVRTGIKNLKVRFNKVFGYFIEIGRASCRERV